MTESICLSSVTVTGTYLSLVAIVGAYMCIQKPSSILVLKEKEVSEDFESHCAFDHGVHVSYSLLCEAMARS